MIKNVFKRSLASLLVLMMFLAVIPVGVIGIGAVETCTEHVDSQNDGNHACDNCGVDNVTMCVDENGDLTCDECAADLNEEGNEGVETAAVSTSGSLSVTDLGYKVENSRSTMSSTVVANNNELSVSTTGSKYMTTNVATITLTNNKSDVATLKFDYTISSSGTFTVDGTTVTANSSFSKEIASKATVKITVTVGKNANANVYLSNISLAAEGSATILFKQPENGSYTVNGEVVNADQEKTVNTAESVAMIATPAAGYRFFGWYSETKGAYLSTNATENWYFSGNETISARFVLATAPIFETAGMRFADLDEAVAYAQSNGNSKITLVGDGILPAKDTAYVIPTGITLLIPFDAAATLYTDTPDYYNSENNGALAFTPFRTLTMAEGARIVVNGALSVSAKQQASTQKRIGNPYGSYGHILMESGSSITVNSGANLYAWGYITGSGSVTVEPGATVYECFQISDWRGGTLSAEMVDAANEGLPVFPFSQYYVQNVEVPMTLKSGATEKVYLTITASIFNVGRHVAFVGNGALFQLGEGAYVIKSYDPTTDRMIYDTCGDITLNSIFIDISIPMILPDGISSEPFTLPINNNMTMNIHSGTVTLTQDVGLQPGVKLTVDQGATLKIDSGSKLFVYDKDQWGNYCASPKGDAQFSAIEYSPTAHYTRTANDIKDVILDINGTLDVSGELYTTSGGAAIISSEQTGKILYNAAAGTEEITNQYSQANGEYVDIPIVAAKLQNADGSYTETAGAKAGTEYVYQNGKWQIPGAADSYEITWVVNGTDASEDYVSGTIPTYKGGTPTKPGDGVHTTYTFAGWKDVATQTVYPAGTDLPAVTGNAAYEAVFNTITSEHVDTEKNHECDICNESMGVHADSNGDGDHLCDYGCGVNISDHTGGTATCKTLAECEECHEKYGTVDSNNHEENSTVKQNDDGLTHTTYYPCCGAVVSGQENISCTDGDDNDHNCDICDRENVSACKDIDKNHACDVCGAYMGTHADADKDHNCDYGCSETIGTCEDADKDHACDYGCDKTYGTHADADKDHNCDYGCTETIGTCEDADKDHACDYGCGKTYGEHADAEGDGDHLCDYGCNETIGDHVGGTATCLEKAVCTECNTAYGEKNPENHASDEVVYEKLNEDMHRKGHKCCGAFIEYQAHTYTEGECVCGDVQTFTITWNIEGVTTTKTYNYGQLPTAPADPAKAATPEYTYTFAGWDKEIVAAKADVTYTATFTSTPVNYTIEFMKPYVDNNGNLAHKAEYVVVPYGADLSEYLPDLPEKLLLNNFEYCQGVRTFDGWNLDVTTMPAENLSSIWPNDGTYTGWIRGEGTPVYVINNVEAGTGWIILDEEFQPTAETGKAYYLTQGFAATTGIGRVPYPTTAINGITYAPNAYDMANADKYNYTDATTALFVFDENGALMQDLNGLYGTNWAVDGQLPWHVGLVNDGENYYYFVGENVMATGNVYVSRDNTELSVVIGGVYTFDADGKLCKYDGIQNVGGTLYYYEDYQLMLGKGLVKIGEDYYYVRSSGALVVNTEYWVANTNGEDVKVGNYQFDENGKLLDPISETKNGVFAEEGGLYYYENGVRTYKGLMEYNGGYIYVRTNGQLAVGTYWITVTNGLKDAGRYEFDENGMMLDPKNGFVVEGEETYYYVNGNKQYAAGLIEYEGKYYYVKSNGSVVRNAEYWITNVNETGIKAGKYSFNAEGALIMPENYGKNGVVDGVYYIDGQVIYGAGIVEYNGGKIYVRSNGQVATGRYWVTNTNGIVEQGYYEFDEAGMMIVG